MQNEAIRLSILFFEQIKGFRKDERGKISASDSYKMKVMNDMMGLLNGNMTPHNIEELIKKYKEENSSASKAYSINDIVKFFNVKAQAGTQKIDKDNLLEQGRFYYHPRLQKTPPAPTVELLPDGTFKSSYDDEGFYLEIKERFTVDDIIDYFYETMGISKDIYRKRDKGAFQYLLKNYDLDLVMFTIMESAVSANDRNKEQPRHPFDIEEYVEDGMAVLEERKNTLYMEGLDHVIPKC